MAYFERYETSYRYNYVRNIGGVKNRWYEMLGQSR
jgi:hypothetical protein